MGDLTGEGIDEGDSAIGACHCEDLACMTKKKALLATGPRGLYCEIIVVASK